MGAISDNNEAKKRKSKIRIFYKNLLKSCDKYDEIKEKFDEIYNPINEQYQELVKIPGLIPQSSQTIIQNAFDNIDEVTGIADDFCSTVRGEFEPIVKRVLSNEEIQEVLKELRLEKTQQSSNISNVDPNTITTSIITKKAIIAIMTVVVISSVGGIYTLLDLDVNTPFTAFPKNGSVIGEDKIEFLWDAIDDKSGIDYYIIELFQEDVGSVSFIEQSKSPQFSSKSLENGKYSWRVKAVDNAGNQGSFSEKSFFTIKVLDIPTAKINTNTNNVKVGQAIKFNGGQSTDTDGFLENYSWDFGDDANGNGRNVSHSYPIPGSYSVRLTVTDNDGQTNTSSTMVNVSRLDVPVAVIQADTTQINIGNTIKFDGSGSFDSDGRIVSHYWDFGDDNTSNQISPSHRYTSPDNYRVTLQVKDNDEQVDQASFDVIVYATPPPIPIIYTPENSELYVIDDSERPIFINFTWSDVYDVDGINYFEIELNDKTYSQINENMYSISLAAGEYEWRVRAVDAFGAKSEFSQVHHFRVEKYIPPSPLWTVADLSWNSDLYLTSNVFGSIQLIDTDVNDSDFVDTVPVKIASGYNPTGFSIELRETGTDTGIFIGTVYLVDLYDNNACDTENITATYVDDKLPEEYNVSSVPIFAYANIELVCIL